MTSIIVKMDRDGVLTQDIDGQPQRVEPESTRPMSEADILAAAESDPDNPPLSAERLAGLRPVSPLRTLRRAIV